MFVCETLKSRRDVREKVQSFKWMSVGMCMLVSERNRARKHTHTQSLPPAGVN